MGSGGESSTTTAPKLLGNNDPFEHEERFLLTRKQVARFSSAVSPRATLEVYDRERPFSYTRTTYFDTDDLDYLRSCDRPLTRRLRVREYASGATPAAPPVPTGTAFVELKQNAGTARSKVRLTATPDLLRLLVEPGTNGDLALAGLDPLSALATIYREIRIPTMAPRLTTWYRRACMTAESGRVRITLDEHLTFCMPQSLRGIGGGGAPAPEEIVATGPARVLEIKLWGTTPEWLSQALEGLHPAPQFSKFRTGMMALAQKMGTPQIEQSPAMPMLFALDTGTAR